MLKKKKIIHLFLLIICLENSLIYPVDWSDMPCKVVDWTWNTFLSHPIPSGLIISFSSAAISDFLRQGPETREIQRDKMRSDTELTKAETAKMRQQTEFEREPGWKEGQVKLMAAAAFEATDPTLVRQRVEEKKLELRERTVRVEREEVEAAIEKTAFLENLKEKMIGIEELLKTDELSEEQKKHLYCERIRLGGIYQGLNSSIAS